MRLAALFSLVAVTPTIVIAIFSVILFDFGLQGWFSQRVSTAIKESLNVAQAYLEEHQRTINADVVAMAQDISREASTLSVNTQRFNRYVEAQAALRALTEAVVFDSSGRLLARAGFSLLLAFDPQVPEWALRRARAGQVVILTPDTEDRVRALIRLNGFADTYLYVGRLVDQRVIGHMDRSRGAARIYTELESKRSDFQIKVALIFAVVALLLLLAAVWVGLNLANHLTRPMGRLIAAAERVGAGDLTARVGEGGDSDELESVFRAFNSMTEELESQRGALLNANQQLNHRRRFIEAVLSGVTAGVIGLDQHGRITLPNRSACELLSADSQDLYGRDLSAIVPEMANLVASARRRSRRIHEEQITLSRTGEPDRTLFARVAAEEDDAGIIGFVVTFDDISELLSAQRKAAWADVARRIAHEIKNPLTPIQLSAERLRRKYLAKIKDDPETFKICTETIVRHVGDIGRMVDEFSAFARMPAPSINDENLVQLMEEAIFLQTNAHPEISFEYALSQHEVIVPCDRQQISRALTNLLQNAIDAIEGREAEAGAVLPRGRIEVRLIYDEKGRAIQVDDNGRGLPTTERHRLTEPYVTTRQRGTGLGLAIVKKIMEDHGGNLLLDNREEGGARVTLLFPPPEELAARRSNQEKTLERRAQANGA